MDEYPVIVYRVGESFDWDGRPTDTLECADAQALKDAKADGWLEMQDYCKPAKKAGKADA